MLQNDVKYKTTTEQSQAILSMNNVSFSEEPYHLQ